MGAALNSAKFEHTIFFRIVNLCMAPKHRNNRYKMVLHSYCINACVVGGTRTFNFVKKSMAHFPHHVAQFTPLAARFPHWPVLPHHTLVPKLYLVFATSCLYFVCHCNKTNCLPALYDRLLFTQTQLSTVRRISSRS